MKKILIFTATYNEIDNIENLVNEIRENCGNADIFIIDDNSPDGTGEFLKNFAKDNDFLKILIRERKDGLDTAHKLAYNYALKNQYDYLITMDADFSHDPKEIKNFLNKISKNDLVLGSRYIKGGKNELEIHRYLLSYFGNKFIRKILNLRCYEFTTSYRAFNLKNLNDFRLDLIHSKGYSFFMETIYQLEKRKFRILEIPIIFAKREQGKSKIPKIEIFRTLLNVVRLFFKRKIYK